MTKSQHIELKYLMHTSVDDNSRDQKRRECLKSKFLRQQHMRQQHELWSFRKYTCVTALTTSILGLPSLWDFQPT